MRLTVGVIGRASGIRGEVRVGVKTDSPRERFAPGVKLLTNHDSWPELTVSRCHKSGKYFVVAFSEITDRNAAETLTGTRLEIDTDDIAADNGYYRHQLVGLRAVDGAGEMLGTVSDLLLGAAQDLLEVTTAAGKKVLVPFVSELVAEPNLQAGSIEICPPGGLFDGNEA